MPQAVDSNAVHPPVPAAHQAVPAPELGGGDLKLGGDAGSPTFADLLDIINPLQHIPVVNTIYRRLTGDTINPAMQLIGGTLFGGPVGAVVAFGSLALAHISGRDLGEHVVALAESATDGLADPAALMADASGAADRSDAFAPPGETGETPDPAQPVLAQAGRFETAAAASLAAGRVPGPGRDIDPPAQQMDALAGRPSVQMARAPVLATPPDAPDIAQAAHASMPGASPVRFGTDALLAFRSDLATIARTAASGPALPGAPAPGSALAPSAALAGERVAVEQAGAPPLSDSRMIRVQRNDPAPAAPDAAPGPLARNAEATPAGLSPRDAEAARLMSQRLARRQIDRGLEQAQHTPISNRMAGVIGAAPATPASNPSPTGTRNTGAVAEQGGWFAEAMLGALQKYEQAKALQPGAEAPPASAAGPARSTGLAH